MEKKLLTYLDQLEATAKEKNLKLEDVCRSEGVALTTLRRWRNGSYHPRQEVVEQLFGAMQRSAAA